MSVPKYKRNESNALFVKELYDLNIRCGQIIMKRPTKYRQNYGDHLIKSCLKALEYAQRANDIFMSESLDQNLKEERKLLLIRTIGICENISTTAQIFFELIKNCDGCNEDCTSSLEYFADKSNLIIKLVKGVIESDKKYFK